MKLFHAIPTVTIAIFIEVFISIISITANEVAAVKFIVANAGFGMSMGTRLLKASFYDCNYSF